MRNHVSTTVPATFKPSGAPITPPADDDPPMASPTANTDLVAIWRSMTVGETANTPVGQLLKLLGVRLVEVEPGELAADGIVGYLSGRIGDAEIQIERTLPQAERESVIRDLLVSISSDDRSYTKRAVTGSQLRPAVVGGNLVHIECPDWCVIDHVAENEGFLVDVYHGSDSANLMGPTMEGRTAPLLHARLNADPFGSDSDHQAPHVVVDDETDLFLMAPAQALKFASNLEAFAAQLRTLVQRAYPRPGDGAPAAEPGHYPWCNTAACNTQPWGDGTGRAFTEHFGPDFNMPFPEGMDVPNGELLRMTLGVSEEFEGRPEISFNCGGNGVLLDEDGTDEAIANLEAALSALRAMRAQMVQEKQA
ncbi:DUF6907 domain-containing protein [Streptomyces drozdowiczii]|uniref:DUF6907 domain-containing protein n=1 Tax=Streptomyces drozdowiczii TaxID=202862 RepID=UPI00403CF62C